MGARYARLDRLFFDDAYTVVAHFPESGGIFAGAEVSYRGVKGRPGAASSSSPTTGVDVYLDIDKGYDTIPTDALAVVGNRSAVGEQYVELQPQTDHEALPARTSSEIAPADTRIPIADRRRC